MKKAVIIATAIGWLISPAAFSASSKASKPPIPDLPPKTANTLNAIPVRGMWKHIVVHHTATPSATPGGIDRFHREQRHMENGMAYHFLIGNGHGMRDGENRKARRQTRLPQLVPEAGPGWQTHQPAACNSRRAEPLAQNGSPRSHLLSLGNAHVIEQAIDLGQKRRLNLMA